MRKKPAQKPILIVPKGYELEDIFDTDDSDFKEKPILYEEVKVIFERTERKQQGV